MINTVDKHYDEIVVRNKKGAVIRRTPEHDETWYFCENREIAYYDSLRDLIYLRTEYILKDFSQSTYNRALSGAYKEMYAELFSMLGVDEKTQLSEYSYF